jgi:hypothetical protein
MFYPPGPPFDHLPIGLKSEYESDMQRSPLPLDEYLEKALAVFIAPDEYSYRELIAAVAQQIGSSHEDMAVDEGIHKLSKVEIGGQLGYAAPLINVAKICFSAGMGFISYMVKNHNYKCIYEYKNAAV